MASILCAADLKGNPDLLIKEVHIRRPIWDLKSPAHHNRDIVHNLWTEISEKLGLPLDIIKNKWKHLRDNFRTELKKTVRGSGNPPQPYQSQWTFFNDLLFLEEQMMKKISRLYTPAHMLNGDCEGDFDQNDSNLVRNSTDFLTHSLFDDNSTGQEPLAWWPQDEVTNIASNHIQNNKRRRYNYEYEPITASIPSDNLLSKIKTHSNDIMDDDFHFMMSLLPFMRSLEAPRKMYVRSKLQELICDFVYNINCNSGSSIQNKINSKSKSNSRTRKTNSASTDCNISSNDSKSND